jgi:phage-related minor tail protein
LCHRRVPPNSVLTVQKSFKADHERGIILHEAAARALQAAQIGKKLPSVAALRAEYEKLQGQKEALYTDYGKLKKQVREYDVIRQNIDSILQRERQPEKERQTERE